MEVEDADGLLLATVAVQGSARAAEVTVSPAEPEIAAERGSSAWSPLWIWSERPLRRVDGPPPCGDEVVCLRGGDGRPAPGDEWAPGEGGLPLALAVRFAPTDVAPIDATLVGLCQNGG